MEQNENQDSIRERIRAYAFDLKLPLVRRDIDLLIQQGLDERWNLWMFTAELLRQEKENRDILHVLHYVPVKKCKNLEIVEDVIPLENLKVEVETVDKVEKVYSVPDQKEIPFVQKENRVFFEIDKVNGHFMAAISYKK